MRQAASSGASASSIRKRSHSSASPAAVGWRRTGVPSSPQRATVTSPPRRWECQVDESLLMRRASGVGRPAAARRGSRGRGRLALAGVLLAPLLDALPEVLGELVPLVLGEEGL